MGRSLRFMQDVTSEFYGVEHYHCKIICSKNIHLSESRVISFIFKIKVKNPKPEFFFGLSTMCNVG